MKTKHKRSFGLTVLLKLANSIDPDKKVQVIDDGDYLIFRMDDADRKVTKAIETLNIKLKIK